MRHRHKVMRFGLAIVVVGSFTFAWYVDTLKGALCRRTAEGAR